MIDMLDQVEQSGSERPRDALLSVVVPMFNEEDVIAVFREHIVQVIDRLDIRCEIVCVNDGSRDNTLAALMDWVSADPRVRVVDLTRNFGKEAALTAGLARARGDAVAVIDADLQDPPELIEEFVRVWREGVDVVIGVRADRTSDSLLKRKSAEWFYTVFNWMSDVPIVPNAGDFRLMDRRVVDAVNLLPERERFMKGLFAWVGFKYQLVEFSRAGRFAGTGKWKPWNLWNFALSGVFSFSTVPLRIWTYLGGIVAVMSLVFMFFIIFRTLFFGIDVPGYASLAVMMLFSLSLNLIGIGVLGEYIARIHAEAKSRPIFLVADEYGEGTGGRNASEHHLMRAAGD